MYYFESLGGEGGGEEFKFDVFLYLTQAHNFSQLVRKLVDIFGAAACALSPIYGAASSWAAYSYFLPPYTLPSLSILFSL